ncbi:thioredoxin-like protein [Thelonectria olida]|uniref:Thioredoxin-like protein n=1 Tax=Thelonectria olida TaxID=1576542 RepID=A0A9P8W599_9HYPO|nr:thioredoxin-like protein [Thelonectria olida]
MADASKKVTQIINDNSVVVFSKSYCPYCRQTKQALDAIGAEYKALELDNLSDGGALQDAIERLTGQRTVPNTFINQKSIGGNSDLQGLLRSGELKTLLADAGALAA